MKKISKSNKILNTKSNQLNYKIGIINNLQIIQKYLIKIKKTKIWNKKTQALISLKVSLNLVNRKNKILN